MFYSPILIFLCILITNSEYDIAQGGITLPTVEKMKIQIRTEHRRRRDLFGKESRHALKKRGFSYMERIASCVGCRPSMIKTALTDPMLACRLLGGVLVSSQYRLRGPHKWKEAREAVVQTTNRVLTPIVGKDRARKLQNKQWWKDITKVATHLCIVTLIASLPYLIFKNRMWINNIIRGNK